MPVDIEQYWEYQWVFPIFSCKVWIKSVQYFFTIVMPACMFLLILLCISNLNTILHFLFVSFVFTFSFACTFYFGTASTQNILFKDKYFALLYWTSQLYLLTNFIYLYVKYYQLFQCFVLYVLFASPFTSAWRYREKSWSTEWSN